MNGPRRQRRRDTGPLPPQSFYGKERVVDGLNGGSIAKFVA
ncbi:hypothetical protein [Streptomyces fagopyri]